MKNKYKLLLILLTTNELIYGQAKGLAEQVNSNVSTILQKQLEYGKPSFDNPYQYSDKDLEVTIPILNQLLLDNRYKAINNEEFSNKIKQIFNRIIDRNSNSKFLYINFIDQCDKQLNFFPNDAENNWVFVVKNQNFITDLTSRLYRMEKAKS